MVQTKKADNYISLQDAAKYCSYSQEYLSLRARQGKLKAKKFGRNWVTKKEWLKEYITGAEEYNNNLEILRIKNLKKVKKIRPIKAGKAKEEIWPPANLPIGEFDEREFSKIQLPQIKEPALRLRFAFATALVFVLLIAGGFTLSSFVSQNLGGVKGVFQTVRSYVETLNQEVDRGFVEGAEAIVLGVQEISKAADLAVDTGREILDGISDRINSQLLAVGDGLISLTYIAGEAGELIVKETADTVSQSFDTIIGNTTNNIFRLSNLGRDFVDGTKIIEEGILAVGEIATLAIEDRIQGIRSILQKASSLTYMLKETKEMIIEETRNTISQAAKSIFLTVANYQNISKEYSYWLSDIVKTGTSAFAAGVSELGQNIAGSAKNISSGIVDSVQEITRAIFKGISFLLMTLKQESGYLVPEILTQARH